MPISKRKPVTKDKDPNITNFWTFAGYIIKHPATGYALLGTIIVVVLIGLFLLGSRFSIIDGKVQFNFSLNYAIRTIESKIPNIPKTIEIVDTKTHTTNVIKESEYSSWKDKHK